MPVARAVRKSPRADRRTPQPRISPGAGSRTSASGADSLPGIRHAAPCAGMTGPCAILTARDRGSSGGRNGLVGITRRGLRKASVCRRVRSARSGRCAASVTRAGWTIGLRTGCERCGVPSASTHDLRAPSGHGHRAYDRLQAAYRYEDRRPRWCTFEVRWPPVRAGDARPAAGALPSRGTRDSVRSHQCRCRFTLRGCVSEASTRRRNSRVVGSKLGIVVDRGLLWRSERSWPRRSRVARRNADATCATRSRSDPAGEVPPEVPGRPSAW